MQYFDKTFFKLLAGLIAIIAISLFIMAATGVIGINSDVPQASTPTPR